MLMVTSLRSPPYSRSARASAVSVLPTPELPTNRNTPFGLFGSSRLARAVRTRWATIALAWRWPRMRSSSMPCRFITVRISSFTMRPSGIPVQLATMPATVWPSTCSGTSGVSPCSVRSWSTSACMACAALLPTPSPASRRARIAWISADSACSRSHWSRSAAWRCSSPSRSPRSAASMSAWSAPPLSSRTRAAMRASSRSRPRIASSSAAGVAFWPSATLAQAVSSTLIALSGSWRPLI
jgi:hypothetical protein